MRRIDDYIGIPWQDRGRTVDGCDCWGLIRLPFRDMLGVELESYADEYSTTTDRATMSALFSAGDPEFALVSDQHRPFDVVLIRERPWHVGLVVRRGWMLHMPEGHTSMIEQYTTGRTASRVEGVYRHISQRRE